MEKSEFEKYVPKHLDARISITILAQAFSKSRKRIEMLRATFDEMNKSYGRYVLQVHSNNWLKMHGYPMRRKGRNGSKKS